MVTLAGCAGYVPGRQSYWDAQVGEMCARDGALKIIEKVILTRQEANLMPRSDGKIALRWKSPNATQDPVYVEVKTSQIRESSPRVFREDVTVIRRSDRKVVASWSDFARVGGDIPTGLAHDSSYSCPDPKLRLEEIQQLFVIREE